MHISIPQNNNVVQNKKIMFNDNDIDALSKNLNTPLLLNIKRFRVFELIYVDLTDYLDICRHLPSFIIIKNNIASLIDVLKFINRLATNEFTMENAINSLNKYVLISYEISNYIYPFGCPLQFVDHNCSTKINAQKYITNEFENSLLVPINGKMVYKVDFKKIIIRYSDTINNGWAITTCIYRSINNRVLTFKRSIMNIYLYFVVIMMFMVIIMY